MTGKSSGRGMWVTPCELPQEQSAPQLAADPHSNANRMCRCNLTTATTSLGKLLMQWAGAVTMVCHRTRSLPTRLRLRSVHCSMPMGLGSSGYSPAGYSSSSAYGVTHKCCGSWKAGIQDQHDDEGSIFV